MTEMGGMYLRLRINSTDSRSAVVGAIPISDIVGKVRLELYPDPHIP